MRTRLDATTAAAADAATWAADQQRVLETKLEEALQKARAREDEAEGLEAKVTFLQQKMWASGGSGRAPRGGPATPVPSGGLDGRESFSFGVGGNGVGGPVPSSSPMKKVRGGSSSGGGGFRGV